MIEIYMRLAAYFVKSCYNKYNVKSTPPSLLTSHLYEGLFEALIDIIKGFVRYR